MLTRQQIYDTVKGHLLKQKDISFMKVEGLVTQTCAYRGEDGKKCAVGCLIPDELYDPKMETKGVFALFEFWPSVMERIGLSKKEHIDLLETLQMIHDVRDPAVWEEILAETAGFFRLVP